MDYKMMWREADEQEALFEWAKLNMNKYPCLELMFHIPNGGSRNAREAYNLKRQGVKPGVPDIFLPVPVGKYHGLFIELKRVKGGVISEYQKEMLKNLATMGYSAFVCNGFEEAKKVIEEYLNV